MNQSCVRRRFYTTKTLNGHSPVDRIGSNFAWFSQPREHVEESMDGARRPHSSLMLVLLVSLSLVGPVARASQRSDASIKIENLVAAMKIITSKPYSFDQQGTLLGRTDADY